MSMTENVKKTGLHLCHLLCYTHKRRARLLTMLLGRESEFQTLFSCIKSNDSNNFMERIIMLKIVYKGRKSRRGISVKSEKNSLSYRRYGLVKDGKSKCKHGD